MDLRSPKAQSQISTDATGRQAKDEPAHPAYIPGQKQQPPLIVMKSIHMRRVGFIMRAQAKWGAMSVTAVGSWTQTRLIISSPPCRASQPPCLLLCVWGCPCGPSSPLHGRRGPAMYACTHLRREGRTGCTVLGASAPSCAEALELGYSPPDLAYVLTPGLPLCTHGPLPHREEASRTARSPSRRRLCFAGEQRAQHSGRDSQGRGKPKPQASNREAKHPAPGSRAACLPACLRGRRQQLARRQAAPGELGARQPQYQPTAARGGEESDQPCRGAKVRVRAMSSVYLGVRGVHWCCRVPGLA